MKVAKHPRIKKYQEWAKKEGCCVQCVNPWYDGLCECGASDILQEKAAKIEKLAHKLIGQGWKP
jgi:hypothetical protein